MRPVQPLVLSVLLAGCHYIVPGTTSGTRTPDDRSLPKGIPPAAGRNDPARESAKKRVSSKEEPSTLFAADRTQCVVTQEEFRTISVGESVACVWSPISR